MVESMEGRSSTMGEARAERLATFTLTPARRVGPGRIERGYQARIAALEASEREAALAAERARGELEVAGRLERGLQRLVDRQEERLELAASREKRLALALGAMQRENELLRQRLELAAGAPAPQLAAPRAARAPRPARRGLFGRVFGR